MNETATPEEVIVVDNEVEVDVTNTVPTDDIPERFDERPEADPTTAPAVEEKPAPTEEQRADPSFDLLGYAPEADRQQFFAAIEQQIQQVFRQDDAVIGILIRPGSLESFLEGFAKMVIDPQSPERNEQLKAQINVAAQEGIGLIELQLYSQMEAQWLFNYYQERGLFKYLQNSSKPSPIRFSPTNLKMMYAMECLDAIKSSIVKIPGGGKFDASQLGMRTQH